MTEENNSKNLLVKIIFYTEYEIIKEEEFNIDTTYEKIKEYFNKNIQNQQNEDENYKLYLKPSYKINDIIFEKEVNIKSLLQSINISELSEIKLWLELEEKKESYNIIKNNLDEEINMIYKPKSNPFSIFSFNINLGIVTLVPYEENIVTLYELDKFDSFSAYCNSPNGLYLSGGNEKNNDSNNFWIIDNNKKIINKKEMPFKKSNHSMLYLKEKLILVAGGDNLKTLFYDISQNTFISCSDLNSNHFKPALFRYNNYIYCLSDLNEKKQYFERLYINENLSLCYWEKIYPFFGNELDAEFNMINYGITSEQCQGCIILGGGKNKDNTYLYNVENNILSLTKGKNEKVYLEEKTFFKYELDKNYFINFSGDFEKKQEIIFLNQKNKSLLLVDVDEIDGKININKIKENNSNIEKEEKKNYGNISIRIIYKKKENEKIKYDILGEKISLTLDDISDEINNENEINEKENLEKENLDNINISQISDDQNRYSLRYSNISYQSENDSDNKNEKKTKKTGIKSKMTSAINGTIKYFKTKKKDNKDDKDKKNVIEGNGDLVQEKYIEDNKESSENNEKKQKKTLTNRYFGKLKDKFIKKKKSSSIDDKAEKNKDKKKDSKKEKERNKSLHIKSNNIKKEQ